MKISLISFTRQGGGVCQTLYYGFLKEGHECEAFCMPEYAGEWGLRPLQESLKEWCGSRFRFADAIVFVSACGIAVRGIAPFVKDKREDPAVVTVDEKAGFVVSLLSGHIGGANELALAVARFTGAVPVVTTATDVNGLFAVDVFARQNGMVIENMRYAKMISAALLDRKRVGFTSRFPVEGHIPAELTWEETARTETDSGQNVSLGAAHETEETEERVPLGIAVTLADDDAPYPETLRLYPRIVTIGIGCRLGTEQQKIREKVSEVLAVHHIPICCLRQAVSIDLKKEEPGILGFCGEYGIPFRTYTKEQLLQVPGEFSSSSFVSSVTGVDNVCERAAVLGADMGTLIQKKYAGDGVTIALAVKDWRVRFE